MKLRKKKVNATYRHRGAAGVFIAGNVDNCPKGVAYRTPNQVLPPEMMCADVDSIYANG